MTSVIYHAPKGDDRVVDMGGHTFFDNQVTEVDEAAESRLLSKLRSNQHFEVLGEAPEPQHDPVDDDPPDEVLKAVHRGRGKYSIMRGKKEIKEGLSKADHDAFNALSDEDKAGYVAA